MIFHSSARIALLLLLAVLFPLPLVAGVERWTSGGPAEDWLNDVALDPLDPSRVYLASARDGVLVSREGGEGWRPSGLNGTLVHALAVDPVDPTVVYALAEHDGATVVWRSFNGGDSWVAFGGELPSPLRVLALDPTATSNLWAVAYDGRVYRSEDGAVSWSPTGSLVPGSAISVRDLKVDPNRSATLLAAADQGIYRSLDGGATWLRVTPHEARQVLFDPHGTAAWAATAAGVWKSLDGGASWEPLPGRGNTFALAVDSATATIYAASADSVFRSANGGQTWIEIERGLAGETILDLALHPGNPLTLYASFINGVWRTTDGGGHWTALDRGLRHAASHRVIADQRAAMLYALTESDTLHRSFDGGENWQPIAAPRIASSLAAGPDSELYLTAGEFVYRSDDFGERWDRLNVASPVPFIGHLRIDPLTPTTLFATAFDEVWKSLDGGVSWQRAGHDLGRFIIDLEIDPAMPERLYAATVRGLFSSSDGGSSWSESELPVADRLITALTVEPDTTGLGDHSTVYAALGRSRILRSEDGAATWLEMAPVGSGPINDLLAIPPAAPGALGGGLYAASEMGAVFLSRDRGSSWRRVDPFHLIDPSTGRAPAVKALAAGESAPGITGVHAATGAGVFSHRDFEKRVLTLQDGRFEVEIRWRDFGGMTGSGEVATVGRAFPNASAPGPGTPLMSRDSAVLEFFSAENWEMLLKVLDGRAANGRFWVFLAAATDVGFTTNVTDTSCGTTRIYENPVSLAAPAITDTEAFEPCSMPAPSACLREEGVLCLGEPVPGLRDVPLADGRFQVEVEWRDAIGQSDQARQVRVPEDGFAESDDSGLFYFFSAENWELLIKVLDGCAVNGHLWVFGAATTDVEYDLTVTDTLSGEKATYHNPLGVAAAAITDTAAFAACRSR